MKKTQTPLSPVSSLESLDIHINYIKHVELSPENNSYSYLVVVWVLIGVQEEAGVDL